MKADFLNWGRKDKRKLVGGVEFLVGVVSLGTLEGTLPTNNYKPFRTYEKLHDKGLSYWLSGRSL